MKEIEKERALAILATGSMDVRRDVSGYAQRPLVVQRRGGSGTDSGTSDSEQVGHLQLLPRFVSLYSRTLPQPTDFDAYRRRDFYADDKIDGYQAYNKMEYYQAYKIGDYQALDLLPANFGLFNEDETVPSTR